MERESLARGAEPIVRARLELPEPLDGRLSDDGASGPLHQHPDSAGIRAHGTGGLAMGWGGNPHFRALLGAADVAWLP